MRNMFWRAFSTSVVLCKTSSSLALLPAKKRKDTLIKVLKVPLGTKVYSAMPRTRSRNQNQTTTMDEDLKIECFNECLVDGEEPKVEEHPKFFMENYSIEMLPHFEDYLASESHETTAEDTVSQIDDQPSDGVEAMTDVCLQTESLHVVDAEVQVEPMKQCTAQTQTDVLVTEQWKLSPPSVVTGSKGVTQGMSSEGHWFVSYAPNIDLNVTPQIYLPSQQYQPQRFEAMQPFGMITGPVYPFSPYFVSAPLIERYIFCPFHGCK